MSGPEEQDSRVYFPEQDLSPNNRGKCGVYVRMGFSRNVSYGYNDDSPTSYTVIVGFKSALLHHKLKPTVSYLGTQMFVPMGVSTLVKQTSSIQAYLISRSPYPKEHSNVHYWAACGGVRIQQY
jgi:hypothetical protein